MRNANKAAQKDIYLFRTLHIISSSAWRPSRMADWQRQIVSNLCAENITESSSKPSLDRILKIIAIDRLGKVGPIDSLARHAQKKFLASRHKLISDRQNVIGRTLA